MRRVKSHRCASTHTPVIVNSVAVPLPPAGDNDNHQCRETKQDARGHALGERTEVAANQKADITDDPKTMPMTPMMSSALRRLVFMMNILPRAGIIGLSFSEHNGFGAARHRKRHNTMALRGKFIRSVLDRCSHIAGFRMIPNSNSLIREQSSHRQAKA